MLLGWPLRSIRALSPRGGRISPRGERVLRARARREAAPSKRLATLATPLSAPPHSRHRPQSVLLPQWPACISDPLAARESDMRRRRRTIETYDHFPDGPGRPVGRSDRRDASAILPPSSLVP